MAVEMSGAEYNLFMSDETLWPKKGMFYDDAYITVDGVNLEDMETDDVVNIKPNSIVRIEGGDIYSNVKLTSYYYRVGSLEQIYKLWKDEQKTEFKVVMVPKERVDELEEIIKGMKGKIL